MLRSVRTMKSLKLLSSLWLIALLSGCISSSVIKDVELKAKDIQKGSKQFPVRNVTDFSDSLRCMDDLFLSFGISRGDYVVMAEELRDKTKKVNAGTRQMMITAISDMTKRSGALKLITYGADSGNLISFLSEAGNKGVYQNIPAFDIIGSISQYDDSVFKKQADAAAELAGTNDGSTIGGGGGKSSSSSVTFMTVDLSIVTAHNLALLPGVSTRNSVSLFNKGSASSYDAGISKTGISYSFSADTKDAVGQSLRGLIELSTIELVGKLVKIPYWNCLGMDPSHKDIRNEVSDWFFQLVNTGIIHRSLKLQMAIRGIYNGPIDEKVTNEYLEAILAMKQRLGLDLTAEINEEFYSAFLNSVPVSVAKEDLAYNKFERRTALDADGKKQRKTPTKESSKPSAAKTAESEKQVQKAAPMLAITSDIDLALAKTGDAVRLNVATNTDGNLSCFFQRGEAMVRVFPNRFSESARLAAEKPLTLPNSEAYSFVVEDVEEAVHCFLSPEGIDLAKVSRAIPQALEIADFSPLNEVSIGQIHEAYRKSSNGNYAYNSITFN